MSLKYSLIGDTSSYRSHIGDKPGRKSTHACGDHWMCCFGMICSWVGFEVWKTQFEVSRICAVKWPDRRTKRKLWSLISILTVWMSSIGTDLIHVCKLLVSDPHDLAHHCMVSVEHNIKHCWRRVWMPSSSIWMIIHMSKEGCISIGEHTECNVCEHIWKIMHVVIKVSLHSACKYSTFDNVFLLPTIPETSTRRKNGCYSQTYMLFMSI